MQHTLIGLSVDDMLTAGAGSLPQVACCSTISSMSEIAYIVTTATAAGYIDMKHADWQYITN